MRTFYGSLVLVSLALVIWGTIIQSIQPGLVGGVLLALVCIGLLYDGPLILLDETAPLRKLTLMRRALTAWRWFKLYSAFRGPGQRRPSSGCYDQSRKKLAIPEISLSKLTLEGSPFKEGGEAYIYRIKGDPNTVLKLFKQPNDPSYVTSQQQIAATARIDEHQSKLAAFPTNPPKGIIAPQAIVRDANGVVGYTMMFVDGAVTLRDLLDPDERRRLRVSDFDFIGIMAQLFEIIRAAEYAGIIFGDLNPDNVLVNISGGEVFVVDSDSFQYGRFASKTYSDDYLIPSCCDPRASVPVLHGTYTSDQDWYAALVMLFQGLLDCHPYFSGFQLKDKCLKHGIPFVPTMKRAIGRISLFSPTVEYPGGARPLTILPPYLRSFFEEYFGNGRFELRPDASLLASLAKTPLVSAEQRLLSKGINTILQDTFRPSTLQVKAERHAVDGQIILAHRKKRKVLRLVRSTDGSTYRLPSGKSREAPPTHTLSPIGLSKDQILWDAVPLKGSYEQGGVITSPNKPRQQIRYDYDAAGHPAAALVGDTVVFVKAGMLSTFNGSLIKTEKKIGENYLFLPGSEIGAVIAIKNGAFDGCTLWHEHAQAVTFSPCEVVGPIIGNISDAALYSDDSTAWLFLTTSIGRTSLNHVFVFHKSGTLLCTGSHTKGVNSFLGSIHGKSAVRLRMPLCEPRSILLSAGAGATVMGFERLESGLTCTEVLECAPLATALREGAEVAVVRRTIEAHSHKLHVTAKLRHPVLLGIEMSRRRLKTHAIKREPQKLLTVLWTVTSTTILNIIMVVIAFFEKRKTITTTRPARAGTTPRL